LQRRHEAAYRETIAQLQDDAIGEIRLMRTYWNGGTVASRARHRQHSELEHQLRNWSHFVWLSGDPLVEQHVHNLDVINWLKRGSPVSAQGQGGCSRSAGAEQGQVFDHHFIEYTYADGAKLMSQCRRLSGCWQNVAEHAGGTRGHADISGGRIFDAAGKLIWRTQAERGGHQQELNHLLAALRRGELVAEGASGAASTMTAILGRMASYSGQLVHWEPSLQSSASLADVQQLQSLRALAPVAPDLAGRYPSAAPGLSPA
jgi:predicted dehydrogenase